MISGKKMKFELARILWRQEVLAMDGGPAWLAERVRESKHREKNVGPSLGLPGGEE